jgi:DNA-binding response OmpR family regulator
MPVVPRPAQPLRVLVADGDDDARLLYRETLHLAGCDVVEASDGRDALTQALVRPPTLLITELCLPLVDGLTLCEILRRDRTTANVPILIVTKETRPTEVDRARKIADAVLAKPTTPDTLLRRLEHLMAHSSERPPRSRVLADAVERVEPAVNLRARSRQRRRPVLAKTHARFATTAPSVAPPDLTCPSCDRPLKYERSHIGGVSERHSEQWDYFTCSICGAFQYRQRTRKLRRLRDDEAQWMRALKNSEG